MRSVRTSRAFPKFESYGTLETAASVVKDAIVGFHGIGRLVGPHIGVVKDVSIAVVGALIGNRLPWGFDFGTSKIIAFVIRASIGAVVFVLMGRLIKPGDGGRC